MWCSPQRWRLFITPAPRATHVGVCWGFRPTLSGERRVPLSELHRLQRALEAGVWRWTEVYGDDGRWVNVRERLLVTDIFIPAREQEMWLDDTLRLPSVSGDQRRLRTRDVPGASREKWLHKTHLEYIHQTCVKVGQIIPRGWWRAPTLIVIGIN